MVIIETMKRVKHVLIDSPLCFQGSPERQTSVSELISGPNGINLLPSPSTATPQNLQLVLSILKHSESQKSDSQWIV